jgi:RNA polymerase sigma-70 factor (ECF subfamily)
MNIPEQFTRSWTLAQPAVRGLVFALVPDFHAAQDLMQDVAVALMNQFETGRQPDHFTAWALGIARNKVLMYYRTRSRSRVVFDEALIEAAAEAWEDMLPEVEPRANALRDCVADLPARSGEIVRLRYLEGMPFDAVADRLGMTSVATRKAMGRIFTALRECIDRKTGLAES